MKTTRIALITLALISSSAWAEEGWYGVGEVSHSSMSYKRGTLDGNLTSAGASGLSSSEKKGSNQWRVQLGYQFNDNFAVEGGYLDLGKAKYNASYSGGTATGTIKSGGVDVAAVAILPLNDKVSLFGKLGVVDAKTKLNLSADGSAAAMDGKTSKTHLSPLVGVGASYQLTQALFLRADLDEATNLGIKNKTGSMHSTIASVGLGDRF